MDEIVTLFVDIDYELLDGSLAYENLSYLDWISPRTLGHLRHYDYHLLGVF